MTDPPLPPLAEFLRWLAEMPDAFSAEPLGFGKGEVSVAAVVADLCETYLGALPDENVLAAFRPTKTGKVERNRHCWVLAACHLLWHPVLRGRSVTPAQLHRLLIQDLAELATVESADSLRTEEERREELIRRTLQALKLRLPGESAQDAEDRLTQVDSIERRRLLRAAAEKEKRAREVRDMMARRAAEEAAAKVSRE
jgi:hypothetical protein